MNRFKLLTYQLVSFGILASILFVLFGSVHHLAFTYNTIEQDNMEYVGWIVALGIELALTLTAFGLREKTKMRDKDGKNWLIFFIIVFCFINFFGNYYYGVASHLQNDNFTFLQFYNIDAMNHFKIILFSSSLPFITLALVMDWTIISKRDDSEKRKEQNSKKKRVIITDQELIKHNERIVDAINGGWVQKEDSPVKDVKRGAEIISKKAEGGFVTTKKKVIVGQNELNALRNTAMIK